MNDSFFKRHGASKVTMGDAVIVQMDGELQVYKVIDMDDKSIAISDGIGKWWFYRDTGEAYAGEAKIIC